MIQQVVVLETEEFQVVLQAFLEGLLTLLGKVLDLAFSHLEVVGLNQNQEILVEDPIPLGLLDEGNQALGRYLEHLVHPAKVHQ